MRVIWALLLLIPFNADARPISYAGGTTAMFTNNSESNAFHLHYSPSYKYSLGYKFEHRRETDTNLHMGQLNYLIHRENSQDSQANIYLKTGIGIADHNNNQYGAGFVGLAADWEDRRFFTSYENRYMTVGPIENGFTQSARVGIAPYIGDYGDLHTWLMLQADHRPESDDNFELTPLVRFFKGTHLTEFGVSTDGNVLFNYVKRF